MQGINSILEITGLGEEYRKPLIRLQKVCIDYKLNDEQWEAVCVQFFRYTKKVRDLTELLDKRWKFRYEELLSSAKALQTIMQGGTLMLSCAGGKADVSAFKDDLQGIFEEHLQQCQSMLQSEGELDADKLASFIKALEVKKFSQQQLCGSAILDIMTNGEMPSVLDALKTKTARHILIGEILFASGALQDYGLAGYWAQANTNKKKADYVRDWAAAYDRLKKASE